MRKLLLLAGLALGLGSASVRAQSLGTLSVGPYRSDANGLLTGPYVSAVERSSDGVAFAARRFVATLGNGLGHAYQVQEPAPLSRAYYRLRQVDLDGTESFSPVASVAPLRLVVTAYPNPAHDFTTVRGAAGSLARLYDMMGRLRRQQLLDEQGQLDLRGLPTGNYLLVVGEQASVSRTRLVIY